MSPRPAICLLVLAWFPTHGSADWPRAGAAPLATAHQVRTLTPEEAEKGLPVKLTGVVTHFNPIDGVFYLQDRSAGIRVLPSADVAALAPGDRVEVEGITNRGGLAPCVSPRSVRKLGADPLPEPVAYDLAANDSRWLDSQWVRTYAVVDYARVEGGATRLHVFTAKGRAELVVPGTQWAAAALKLDNQLLTVNGVCVATAQDRRVSGAPTLLLSELPKPPAEPIDPPGEPNAPPQPINHLLHFTPDSPPLRRAKIAGVVTAVPMADALVVQDASGGALVMVANPPVRVPVGTRVEAHGLARVDGRQLTLTHATVTPLARAELPAAAVIRATELARGTRNTTLVSLEGRVEEVRTVEQVIGADGWETWTAVVLSDGGVRFVVYLPGSPEKNEAKSLEVGAVVSVAGVLAPVSPDRARPTIPGVFPVDRKALKVLTAPRPAEQQDQAAGTWWSSQWAGFTIFGGLTAALLGGGWLISLRNQVRRAAREALRQSDERAKLEQELREAAELEVVGRLTGGIAHDFNNLLTVINGCAELLGDEAGDDTKVVGLTEGIRQAGEKAAVLTGQLLTITRKREVQIGAVNLNEVVTETAQILGRVIREDVRIETTLAPDLPTVYGEAGWLHQVVMNLAVNARDAMPQGGVLSFATSVVNEPVASGPAGPARPYVRLTVSDTGMGMTDEVRTRIFEPGFTTKPAGEGSGLGLATVYGIVKQLRGRIQVDSAIGRGSRFTIDLRVHTESASNARRAYPTPPTPLPGSLVRGTARLAGKTVLVVEDDEMVRVTLASGLAAEKATVLAADRPEQALQLLAAHAGRLDVLVTDVVMPGMNGLVLAEKVRGTHPGVRVVFMSGHTTDEVLRRGVVAEQVEFLQKPFTPDHLTNRLRRVLAAGETAV